MGNSGSKSSRMPSKQKKRRSGTLAKKLSGKVSANRPAVRPQPQQQKRDPEKEALEELRTTLHRDLNTFILDNLLLSVQFFQNFERELGTLRSTPQTEPEAKRNRLLKDQQRHCLTPDRLHQLVARRVQYRPQHGESKHVLEPLLAQRLVVVQENVELLEGRDSGHYGDSSSSRITYGLSMETASPGYVKLYMSKMPTKRRVTYETIDGKSDDSSDESTKADGDDEGIGLGREGKLLREDSKASDQQAEDSSAPSTSVISPVFNRPPHPLPDFNFAEALHRRVEGGSFSSGGSIDGDVDTPEVETPRQQQPPRLVFGPRSPDREMGAHRTRYTKTERRLSGIRRPRMTPHRPIPPRVPLVPSSSLPNLSAATSNTRVSPANSESSGYKSSSSLNLSQPNSRGSESEYGYGTITELRTPRPICLRRLGKTPVRSSEIPTECFKMREIPQHEDDSDSEEDNPAQPPRPRSNSELFTTRYYLNSTNYMASFADVFIDRLFEPLGFSKDNTESPMMQGATIHCNVIHQKQDSFICKTRMNIMPSIGCRSWPNEGFEWIRRIRKTVKRQNVVYQWPTKKMVDHIQRFGYNILPVGYLPTKGKNDEHQLEWQLAFPQAEAYLESCMTHAQLRCYLFALALYKSFLEPVQNSELGLTPVHLRTLLFWKCERNYADWPDLKPGVTLTKYLHSVYETLKREKMADYFLPHRNLYESVPLKYVRRVQEQLHRILENLTIYMIAAIRDLRYVEGEDEFYPRLDLKRLYDIVITDDFVSMLNPSLGLAMKEDKKKEKSIKKKKHREDSDDSDVDDLWRSAATSDRNREWYKQVRRQIEAEKAVEKLALNEPRKSTDSINLKTSPSMKPDPMRRKLLLELFIPHFIAMARRSLVHSSYQQALLYLTHSERLNVLLQEEPNADHKMVREFLIEIRTLRVKTMEILNPPVPPEETGELVFVDKRNIVRQLSAVEVVKKPSMVMPRREAAANITLTIAQVHSGKMETDTDNLHSTAASANPSDEEGEDEDTSL